MCNISSAIKLAPTSAHKESFMVKKLEKWEIFNFADLHLKSHILPFYKPTIQTISNIAINYCTSMLVAC